MSQIFRLIEAKTAPFEVTLPWRKSGGWYDKCVHLKFDGQTAGQEDEHLTAIIGQNGMGKSHLLSAIAQTFVSLETAVAAGKERPRDLPLSLLRYAVGADECQIEQSQAGGFSAYLNGALAPLSHLPRPTRVVALTITPFDKFPIPRPLRTPDKEAVESGYRYLGLRDRTGRASIANLLFRSLQGLFESAEGEAVAKARIGKVFEFLSLRPELSVVYRVRMPRDLINATELGAEVMNEKVIKDVNRLRRLREVVREENLDDADIRHLVGLARDHARGGFLTLKADFSEHRNLDRLFSILWPLRRAGFLQLTAVEVAHLDGNVTDLKKASSGQLSTVTAILSLAAAIEDSSLILIDEPELSLHPKWQVKYVDLLLDTFSQYVGCHYVIATHSPMVISELPRHACVVSLDEPEIPQSAELAGQSADYLLAEAFQVPTNNNRHVRNRIIEALQLAADGKADTPDFARLIERLDRFAAEMPDDDPVRTVITDLDSVFSELGADAKKEPTT